MIEVGVQTHDLIIYIALWLVFKRACGVEQEPKSLWWASNYILVKFRIISATSDMFQDNARCYNGWLVKYT
jgi:hypothetical protein